MDEQYCSQCGNHCPKEALQCGRGRAYFGLEPAGGGGARTHEAPGGGRARTHEAPSGAVGLLLQCGQLLHHGGADGDNLLSALDAQEQAELERLLGVLLADWKGRMPAGAKGRHHGRHR